MSKIRCFLAFLFMGLMGGIGGVMITPSRVQSAPVTSPLSQQITKEITDCVLKKLAPNLLKGEKPSGDDLQGVAMECVIRIVFFDAQGKIRLDADQRMKTLMEDTGITVAKTISEGQGSVSLEKLTNSDLFLVPVSVNGKTEKFILDTGASNSIIESGLAQKLGLKGTKISSDILAYFVVGNHCDQITATLHSLPPITVTSASVKGMNGMGLPKTSIPGNASGVLGLDFLSNFDLKINPQTLQLNLLPPTPFVSQGISLEGKFGVMTAEVLINGQGPFRFLLDTGADVMVVSDGLAAKLSLQEGSRKPIEVRGFCGLEKGEEIQLKQVVLGQYQQENLTGVVLQNKTLDLLGVDGIVGQNFLKNYDQHWRFSPVNSLGFPDKGNLLLTPLKSPNQL